MAVRTSGDTRRAGSRRTGETPGDASLPRGQTTLLASGSTGAARTLPVLQRRGDAVFYELPAQKLVTQGSGMMTGMLTVNPYVGCEFSCAYCYAPYAHGWLMERLEAAGRLSPEPGTPTAFDRAIFVKRSADDVVRTVLRNPGRPVCFGTSTDPYQPAERRFGVTRGILSALAGLEGLDVSITTKSPLVLRDLDLLRRIRERSRITVHVSLASVDRRLLREVEPRSPTPERRLDALRRLRDAGIRAGVFAMPLLPGLTDTEEQIDALFAAAREAGAAFVVAGGVRLSAVAWPRFVPVLRRLRPDLVDAYETIVRAKRSPKKAAYRKKLDERIARARARHGFGGGYGSRAPIPPPSQLTLL